MANLPDITATSLACETLTFSDLAHITEVLLADIGRDEEEFQAKFVSMRAEDQQICNNEEQLIEIGKFMHKLQTYTLQLETELEEQMGGIDAAEHTLQRLEQANRAHGCDDNYVAEQNSDYVHLVKLLMRSDLEAKGNRVLCQDLEFYRNATMPETSPYKLVVDVLDHHVRALTNIEKQMQQLESGANAIKDNFSSFA